MGHVSLLKLRHVKFFLFLVIRLLGFFTINVRKKKHVLYMNPASWHKKIESGEKVWGSTSDITTHGIAPIPIENDPM